MRPHCFSLKPSHWVGEWSRTQPVGRLCWRGALAAALIMPAGLLRPPDSMSQTTLAATSIPAGSASGLDGRLDSIEALSRRADAGQKVPIPADVIPRLVESLHDRNIEVRLRAIDALNGIGTGAEDAISPLIDILRDRSQPADLRRHAVIAIRSIYADPALVQLSGALGDTDRVVRTNAAGALGSTRDQARMAIPQLLKLVRDDPYSEVRAGAADVIGKIDPANREVWNALNSALQDRSWRVRRSAADALGEIGAGAKLAVPNLLLALENKNFTLRTSAAKTLGLLGPEAKNALPELKNALLNNNNSFAQGQAAGAIGNIGTDDPTIFKAMILSMGNQEGFVRSQAFESFHKLIDVRVDKLLGNPNVKDKELEQAITFIVDAQKALDTNDFTKAQREVLRNSLRLLQAKRAEKAFISIFLLNPWFWLIASFLGLQFGMFWLRPLWLLKIDAAIRSYSFKVPYLGTDISLQSLLFLKYRPRVLDAWVSIHVQSFQEEFRKIENVEARKIFIPSPATLDGRTLASITNQDLDSHFCRPILIWGEGGVGKTSLACQLAEWSMADKAGDRICTHRMLPIFFEEDFECSGDDMACQQALIDTISGKLKLLTHEDMPVSKELLENLLLRWRIMVIVDHLSEMNEVTRRTINPDNPAFLINALVVTSRQRDILGQVNKLMIKPLRIMGNRLSSFMEAYLTKHGKRDLFTDSEFFDACSHLSRMVGQREVTAMLATLYARQMISAKVEAAQDISTLISDNIPDLMLSYLNQLNKELGGSRIDQEQFNDRTIHKDAMALSWECLKENFNPSVIHRDNALAALAVTRGDKAEVHLRYLEDRLSLVQTIGASQDQLRFSLDPLAEYLAALHLIALYDSQEERWLEFFAAADLKPGSPASIHGFLAAVQDCWVIHESSIHITPRLWARMNSMQDLNNMATLSIPQLGKV
jgi:HEAT repeat protein